MDDTGARIPLWQRVTLPPESALQIKQALVYITAYSANDGKEHFFGTGFVVGESAYGVICMTASHVLTAAVESAFHYNNSPWNRLSYGFKKAAMRELFANRRVQVAVGALDQRRIPIEFFSYEPSVDIAMFGISLPADTPRPNFTVLAINTDIHVVGQPVLSVGAIKGPDSASAKSEIDGSTTIDFQTLSGSITGFERSSTLVYYPQYNTTIPTTGGMSGGPVLVDYPEHGTIGAIGVISSDLEVKPPITDTSEAGATKVSTLRVAHLLGFDMPGGQTVTFRDLCESGQILDIGHRWRYIRVERIPGDPPQWKLLADNFDVTDPDAPPSEGLPPATSEG